MTKTSTLLSLGQNVVDLVTGTIGRALYDTVGHIFILLLDWLQSIFRGLAGLEGMKINGQAVNGGEEKYDIVFWLVQTDIITDIFWSMILFSAFLLIIMTVLALVKNTYEEKQKPVWDIISLSFKGLFGFILVPAMILVGLAFSNVLLQAIDAGTSFGNSTKMSTTLFMSAAYDANKVRIAVNEQSTGECREAFVYIVEKTNLLEVDTSLQSDYNALGTLTLEDYEEIATKIDNAFTSGKLVGPMGYMDAQSSWDVIIIYNMWKMNYVILLVGGCVLIGLFFKMCWGMIGRMFKVCFDFVLIPVACAMTPFDNGKANKSIQGDMVKNVTMAYGTVGALNLYFSILPIVNTIEFNNGGVQSWGVMNSIFQLMISVVGLFSCNAIIKTVNGWFGTGDVLAEGDSTFKAFQGGMKSMRSGFGVGEKVKKTNKFIGNKLGAYKGGALAADKAGKSKFGQFKGGIKGMFGTTAAAKYMDEASISKNAIAGKKAGTDYWNEKNAAKGTMMDMFSRENARTERRKAELDTVKAISTFNKKYGSLDVDEQKKIWANTPEMQAYIQNDAKWSKVYEDTELLKRNKEKQSEGQSDAEAFARAIRAKDAAEAQAQSMKDSMDSTSKGLYTGFKAGTLTKDQEETLTESQKNYFKQVMEAESKVEELAGDAKQYARGAATFLKNNKKGALKDVSWEALANMSEDKIVTELGVDVLDDIIDAQKGIAQITDTIKDNSKDMTDAAWAAQGIVDSYAKEKHELKKATKKYEEAHNILDSVAKKK